MAHGTLTARSETGARCDFRPIASIAQSDRKTHAQRGRGNKEESPKGARREYAPFLFTFSPSNRLDREFSLPITGKQQTDHGKHRTSSRLRNRRDALVFADLKRAA